MGSTLSCVLNVLLCRGDRQAVISCISVVQKNVENFIKNDTFISLHSGLKQMEFYIPFVLEQIGHSFVP